MRGLIYAVVEAVWRLKGCWVDGWNPRDWTFSRTSPRREQ
jgi:hypothetical protein